ncbi:MAG TPA: helix-turn-helix transcriptional regulator [Thermoanaerobaculia bacterium]|nr:helix-turn-helix transcriptional regulator [Thermoanaerobaculia bacterium]
MDIVLKLRELRTRAQLHQSDVAGRSGLGVKTISSFESGSRISTMKVSQLERILAVYGVTLAQFFSRSLEHDLAPWETVGDPLDEIALRIESLPPPMREIAVARITGLLDGFEASEGHRRMAVGSTAATHAHIQ